MLFGNITLLSCCFTERPLPPPPPHSAIIYMSVLLFSFLVICWNMFVEWYLIYFWACLDYLCLSVCYLPPPPTPHYLSAHIACVSRIRPPLLRFRCKRRVGCKKTPKFNPLPSKKKTFIHYLSLCVSLIPPPPHTHTHLCMHKCMYATCVNLSTAIGQHLNTLFALLDPPNPPPPLTPPPAPQLWLFVVDLYNHYRVSCKQTVMTLTVLLTT